MEAIQERVMPIISSHHFKRFELWRRLGFGISTLLLNWLEYELYEDHVVVRAGWRYLWWINPFCWGHFKRRKIMPGHLMAEMMVQAGSAFLTVERGIPTSEIWLTKSYLEPKSFVTNGTWLVAEMTFPIGKSEPIRYENISATLRDDNDKIVAELTFSASLSPYMIQLIREKRRNNQKK